MKIVIAPDSFKESLSAVAVANAIERGLRHVLPRAELVKVPLADGGEGTTAALVAATAGKIYRRTVTGPLGEPVRATFGILGDRATAVVETAAASGLPLVPVNSRNPLLTTTYGTGELIRHALTHEVRRLIVGVGGSATNDGAAGMMQALGARFYDCDECLIDNHAYGGMLDRITRIDLSQLTPRLAEVEVIIACDVRNPLVGPTGAAAIYGPQKGATSKMVVALDANLHQFGVRLEQATQCKFMLKRGAGAGGGLSGGLMAIAAGKLRPGADLVMELVDLPRILHGAALVITGEGQIDSQTMFGKVPAAVATLARRVGVPVVALGGALTSDSRQVLRRGIAALASAVARPMSLETALKDAESQVQDAAERIGCWIKLGFRLAGKEGC
ncbi:MAG: glycerate kinase [Gammaproteobacteria bacterium]|nr:glycerate kinase [Gammaproteobacteria bacterium]